MPIVNAIPNITPNAVSNQQNGLLQSMRPGQSVTVEVVSSEPGRLTVKTPDGQSLSAEFPGATVMAPGDKLELTLLSNAQGEHPQFQLSAVNNQNVQISTSVMESKMIDLGVEPSEINVKAAEFLAERGIQPTPERLATLTKIATYFPQLPASTALFIAANNIAPTRSNVTAIAEWLAGNDLLGDEANSLGQDVKDIINQLSTSMDENTKLPSQNNPVIRQTQVPVNNTQVQSSPQMTQTFTESFVGQVTKNPEFPTQTISLSVLADFAKGLSNMSQPEAKIAIENFLNNFTSLSGAEKVELAEILNNAYRQATENTKAEVSHNENKNVQQGVHTNTNNNGVQQQTSQVQQPQQNQPISPQTQIAGQTNSSAQNVTAAEEQVGVSNSNINVNISDGNSGEQGQINSSGNQVVTQNNTDLKAEAQKVLEQIEKLVVSIKNDSSTDAEALKETLKTQQKTADSIKDGLARIAGENSTPAQKAGDMATRIQLGNQIDNFYYCQVPFKMGESQNTAELYVFNRKKNNAADDRVNTTILIALETQRMGRVETVLRAEENNLNLEFRVETDKIQKYLEKETVQLKKKLQESSFNVVGVKVVRIDVPATPLNVDQLVGQKEDFELKTIDISI